MRDLLAVAAIAAVIAYVVVRYQYSSIPTLPRLAGASAAIIGIAEGVAGWGLRARIRRRSAYLRAIRRGEPVDSVPPPVPPLFAARTLSIAKASALAAAALAGLWIGFAIYVAPEAGDVTAAAADSVTAGVGIGGSVVFLLGALFLENCCRAPDDGPPDAPGDQGLGA